VGQFWGKTDPLAASASSDSLANAKKDRFSESLAVAAANSWCSFVAAKNFHWGGPIGKFWAAWQRIRVRGTDHCDSRDSEHGVLIVEVIFR
jgi:hypothetical protein